VRTAVCTATFLASLAVCASTAAGVPPRHATVIADSVLTAVQWNPAPRSILTRGIDVRLDVGVCRRIAEQSCPFDGDHVPTLLDLVQESGPSLGDVVLVEVGYNDPAPTFATDVEDGIDALLAAGVKHVLWANLRGLTDQYRRMNAALAAVASRHPEVTVVDWDGYSRPHWDWFQSDSIHLDYTGAMHMATLFHTALVRALAPPFVLDTRALPPAHPGVPYAARLVAEGGVDPYAWRVLGGPLPRGLHLLADGRLVGRVTRALGVRVQVTDATGQAIRATLRLEVDGSH
jgi:hypothetical protein